ncbi:MAG TPA: hypothetical protein VKO43_07745 [Candidatus Krumholzibacteriaceae bacterium]|nr:hypothetical protein [Candidatus Krumholzibacteriaceae bacterium]
MNNITAEREIFYAAAKSNIDNLVKTGKNRLCAPGGHNGPYFDVETPVRNTAHWIITYAALFQNSGDGRFADAANLLLNYLISPEPFIRDEIYIQRQKRGKDWCNGLIGQAWVIEALAVGGRILNRADALEKARRAAIPFRFDPDIKAWNKIDPANNNEAIDYTLNHQIWYAAAKSELPDEESDMEIRLFLDSLNQGAFRVRSDGLIAHLYYAHSVRGLLLRSKYFISEKRRPGSSREKETGYHLYNLYSLARLHKRYPDHPFFKSERFKRAKEKINDPEFYSQLECSRYAYPYNAPAFELPMAADEFNFETDGTVFEEQVKRTFCSDEKRFCRNCPDPITLNARIYEWFLNHIS